MCIKKVSVITLILTLIYSFTCFSAPWINMNITYDGKTQKYNAENIYLYINGKRVENLPMPAIILNSFTLVPARETFEPLGAKVEWNKNTEEVTVTYKEKKIVIKINSTSAQVDNEVVSLSAPAKIINNKTMIPARFIAQSLGMKVEWDAKARIVNIRENPQNESLILIEPNEVDSNSEKEQSEIVTEPSSESFLETTTERAPVNLKKTECENGVVRISADGNLGDFATKELNNKKITYLLSKTNLPEKEKYSFNDDFVEDVIFNEVSINGKKFTEVVLNLNKWKKPVSYISKDSKTFIVDFVNNAPDYEKMNVADLDEEPLSSDSDIAEDNIKNTSNNLSEITFDNNIFYKDGYLYIKKKSGFNINNITQKDNYQYKEYVIDMGCNLSDLVKQGKYAVNNEFIDSVEIVNSSSTEVKIKEKRILAYNIVENTDYICIQPILPKKKYSKIVVLDAGHGGDDPGAISEKYDVEEKDITLSIVKKTVDLLEKDGKIKVYAVRLDDTFYTRPERADLANELGDIFISVHANSFSGEKANGTEVWYYPHSNDSIIGLTCEELARCLQKNLIKNLKSTDRGIKSTDYDVLAFTNIPAALCEMGFITNPDEAVKLKSDEYRNLAALAIYNSIMELFEKYKPQR